jgi:hypothetical protein
MKKNIFIVASLIVTSLINMSCGGEVTIDEGIHIEEIETVDELDEFSEDLFESPDMDYHLPSALQVASIFKKSGMKFNSEAMNSTDNSSKYTTAASQMLNFGVYSADIAFCVINNQTNEAREIVVVIKELAEAQGMNAIFDNQDLVDRFESSLDMEDSIEFITNEIHERTEEYMLENEILHFAAVHYAGAWIEGMYLGVIDYDNNNEKMNVGSQIVEQMEILSNIIKGAKDPINKDIGLEDIIADLEKIQYIYVEFESVKEYKLDPALIDFILPDEEYIILSGLIKDIRSKVISA